MERAAIAGTPEPPYWAVVFVSVHSDSLDGYSETMRRMEALAAEQPGYLGMDSARDGIGVSVSYWRDEESISAWRDDLEHAAARERGREQWYDSYSVKVARVERAYDWVRNGSDVSD